MAHGLAEVMLVSSPSHPSAPQTRRHATVTRATGGTDASLLEEGEEEK